MNKERIAKVVSYMEKCGLNQILISSTPSVYYLTGLWIEPHERLLALYMTDDGRLTLFAKGDFPGLIFTYMCAFDMQSEFDYLQNVIDLFKSNDSNCYVVELCADFEERLVRNKSENRLLHKESKRNLEWSEAEMRKTSEKYRLNSYDGESLPFENYIKIDNTTLAPDEVAKMIQTHFAIEGRKE